MIGILCLLLRYLPESRASSSDLLWVSENFPLLKLSLWLIRLFHALSLPQKVWVSMAFISIFSSLRNSLYFLISSLFKKVVFSFWFKALRVYRSSTIIDGSSWTRSQVSRAGPIEKLPVFLWDFAPALPNTWLAAALNLLLLKACSALTLSCGDKVLRRVGWTIILPDFFIFVYGSNPFETLCPLLYCYLTGSL